jgi:phosphocarrier protein
MLERDVEVVNANGIHARPAAEIVKTAAKFASHITLGRDGMEVNGKSIMGVMMLAAECGSFVTVKAEGADEDAAIAALAALIASKFGEKH